MNTTSEVKELCLAVGAFVVAGVLGFFALATSSSCAARHDIPVSNIAGEALTRAIVRGDSARSHVRAAIPDASPTSAVHLKTADAELTVQRKDQLEAKQANAAEVKRLVREKGDLQGELDKLHSRIEVKAGTWIRISLRVIFWSLGGLVGGGIILYILTLFVPLGPVRGIIRFLAHLAALGLIKLFHVIFPNLKPSTPP
jgi:hypothetical protein